MEDLKIALKVNDLDNVATIFANGIVDGSVVEVQDKKGNREEIAVTGDVPYGHKIAVKDIHIGEKIDAIVTETWIGTAAVQNYVGHAKNSDRFISFNYKGGSDLELGYYKHYTLEDLKEKANAMLEGVEMSEDMKSQYGI